MKNHWDFLIAAVYSLTVLAVFGITATTFDETEIKGWIMTTGIAGGGHFLVKKFLS